MEVVFEGVYRASDWWVNGQFVGSHQSGYTPFRWRLDTIAGIIYSDDEEAVRGGATNVIATRIDPRANEGWWYEGGGIYRHARIEVRNGVAVVPYGVGITPVVMGEVRVRDERGRTGERGRASGCGGARGMAGRAASEGAVAAMGGTVTRVFEADVMVPVEVVLWNMAPGVSGHRSSGDIAVGRGVQDATVTVTVSVGDREDEVSSNVTVPAGGRTNITLSMTLPNLPLWHPTSPALFDVHVTVTDATGVLDATCVTTGARRLNYTVNDGVYVNGEYVKLRGMSNHQDFGGVGTGVPPRLERYRVRLLEEFGVNAWRTAHNPVNPELMDAFDELGMMTMAETRNFGLYQPWVDDLRTFILRDRNHPSVIMWSICNEYGCTQQTTDAAMSAARQFKTTINSVDTTRPVTMASYMDPQSVQFGLEVMDIFGSNYVSDPDGFHAQHPNKVWFESESCSCTSDREEVSDPSIAHLPFTHAYPCERNCWEGIAQRRYALGSFDWTGFDYKGEPSPFGWPSINSHFGVLDMAGFSKPRRYYYEAWFVNTTPYVRIVTSWSNVSTATSTLSVSACPGGTGVTWSLTGGRLRAQLPSGAAQCVAVGSAPNPPVYQPLLVSCDAAPANWESDSYQQISAPGPSGGRLCLDIYADQGPEVDVYPCKNAAGTNQVWRFSGGSIISGDTKGCCAGMCLLPDMPGLKTVWVYTNQAQVDLILNGRSIGTSRPDPYTPAMFTTTFEPGTLIAVARNGSGATTARHVVNSFGEAAALTLEVSYPPPPEALAADGQDVAIVTIGVVDAAGVPCGQGTSDWVTVAVEGPGYVLGTANGDPSDIRSPDWSPKRQLYNGLMRAIIRTTTTAGRIGIRVTAPGLQSASVTVMSAPANAPQRI